MDVILMVEIIGSIWLTLAIFMLGRGYRWWLFYAAANLPFSIVQIDNGNYWYTIMGFICCVSGIRNYFIKKKEKIDVEIEAMSHLK